MSDYYQLPPKEKKERSFAWVYLLLLLLFLLGLIATWWSLRLQPGEIGTDPMLSAASLPPAPAPLVDPVRPEPVIEAGLAADLPEEPAVEAPAEPLPAEVAPPPLFSDVRWRETSRFTGADAAGRSGDFTAYVLVGDETWTYARADAVLAAGLDQPVETAFGKLALGAGICDLDRVIAIGAASVEGTSEVNTFLSHTRGHALKAAIAANLQCDGEPLRTSVLDLGYSRQPVTCPSGTPICPDVSAPQRPVAMILVTAPDPETDLGEALRSGIVAQEAAGLSVLPGVSVADYSAFDLR